MKAINEFAAVLVFAALIAGACAGRTMLPVAPDAGGASRSGTYPADGMGCRSAAEPGCKAQA